MKRLNTPLLIFSLALWAFACNQLKEEEIPKPDTQTEVFTSVKSPLVLDLATKHQLNATFTLQLVSQPSKGTAQFLSEKLLQYTPLSNISEGEDSFQYEVCKNNNCQKYTIKVTLLNETEPVPCSMGAVGDFYTLKPTFSVDAIWMDVLSNDKFCNNAIDTTSLKIVKQPKFGTAQVQLPGILYQLTDFSAGSDTLIYSIAEKNKPENIAYATVIIKIDQSCPLHILNDQFSMWTQNDTLVDVLINDSYCTDEIDWDEFKIIKAPLLASASVVSSSTTGKKLIYYELDILSSVSFQDSLVYQLVKKDGSIQTGIAYFRRLSNTPTIAYSDYFPVKKGIIPNNGLELYVLQNDIFEYLPSQPIPPLFEIIAPPSNGTATVIGNKILYKPNSNFIGQDSFDYRICNSNTECSAETVKIVIFP